MNWGILVVRWSYLNIKIINITAVQITVIRLLYFYEIDIYSCEQSND